MKKQQTGVALLAAIFLVVVFGAAAVMLAVIAVRGNQQTTQSLLNMRAQYSASAALEYAVQSLINGDDCADVDGTVSINAYSDFTVTLSCSLAQYGSTPINLYTLTSTAEFGVAGNADYVWFQQSATVEL